jgi:pyruvate/2-oxoglutarate dehydrogenase complex dihydrolipoamide dehydrogenase (E3) component
MDYDALMLVVFTDPQVAKVGADEEQARKRGDDPVTADYPFDDHGKSLLMEAPRGYVKLVADRNTGRLLGAECVGKDASELIHAMTVPVALRLPVTDCLKADWYHPTLAEIWEYPLQELSDQLDA